jgi:polygalacturonase
MKRKLLLFVGTSVAFSAAVYLIFLLFGLAAGTTRLSESSTIRFAALIGIFSSGWLVFFTGFFEKQKKYPANMHSRKRKAYKTENFNSCIEGLKM